MSKKAKSNILFTALLMLPIITFLLLGNFRLRGQIFYWLGIDGRPLRETMIGLLYLIVVFNICILWQNRNITLGILGCVISATAISSINFYYSRTLGLTYNSLEPFIIYVLLALIILLSGIALSIFMKRAADLKKQPASIFPVLLLLPVTLLLILLVLPVVSYWFMDSQLCYTLYVILCLIIVPSYLITIFNIFVLQQHHNVKQGIIGCVTSDLAIISVYLFYLDVSLDELIGFSIVALFILLSGIGISLFVKRVPAIPRAQNYQTTPNPNENVTNPSQEEN